jgi:hypothetical protein
MSASLKTSERDAWRRHSEAWEISGLTQRAYCERECLEYRRFVYYHNRRLSESRKRGLNFIEVGRSKALASNESSSLQLILPNGIRVDIVGEVNSALLTEVLRVAGAITCLS